MRMVDSYDIPRAVLELELNFQHAHRIHLIAIVGAFGVQVSAFSKCMNHFLVGIQSADHEPAALIRIRRFDMIVDLTQHGKRYFNHSCALAWTTPPVNRIMVAANSCSPISTPSGANVTHKSRVQSSVTRVRMESETGLPKGPSASARTGKCARWSMSRPMPS